MRAVLISAYVVLLVAIVSEGPAHALENSAHITAVVAAVNQSADELASLVEAAEETHGYVETIAQSLAGINALMHQYVQQYITGTATGIGLFNKPLHQGCKLNNREYPHGSTLDGEGCGRTCTGGIWTSDNSSLCCEYKDDYYPTGTTINEEGLNRTCEDEYWNIKVYHPVFEFRTLHGKETVEYYYGRNWDYKNYWVDSLNTFIKPYERYEYSKPTNFKHCDDYNRAGKGEVCMFDYQMLGDKCTKAEDWGYSRGNYACIILKMHRRTDGWTPDVYRSTYDLTDDMSEDLKEYIEQKTEYNYGSAPAMVWVDCKTENPDHQDYISRIEYTPWQGFPAFYFPYMDTPGYMDPIVAVSIVTPTNNVPIKIVCKAYAKNIVHSVKNVRGREEQLGAIHFELHNIE